MVFGAVELQLGVDRCVQAGPLLGEREDVLVLDGVRELKLVNKLMQTRLEELANKLDPNVSDSLSRRIRLRQASATKMTELEVKNFYDEFDELWEPFLDDREWFDPDELSSYYRLAKPRLTMMSRSTSAND